ncbi:MAG: ABC transporter permease [Methanoregula sp.]
MLTQLADFAILAFRQVKKKKMRVLLTALGIAIGIAAVIGIFSLGEGIRYSATESIRQQTDLTLIEVTPDVREGVIIPISPSKEEAIRSIPHTEAAGGIYTTSFATKRQTNVGVVGIRRDDFIRIFGSTSLKGDVFAPGSQDLVTGRDIATTLQKYEGVRLGDTAVVTIRRYDTSGLPQDQSSEITIRGIFGERNDQFDNLVLMDRDTVREFRGNPPSYDAVYVRVDSPDNVFSVVEDIRALGLTAKGPFEQIDAVNRLMDTVVLFLSLFAAISLVIGALMIINTMIISVMERTREIGISMAIGANRINIITLIMLECLYIGIAGGILGIVLGIVFSTCINTIGKAYLVSAMGDVFAGFSRMDLTLITPGILLLGFGIAVALSLLAGIYPALKAAHMNPVDAIRNG